MARPDDQARAMCLIVYRWQCHAQGQLEELAGGEVEAGWQRWQECLVRVAGVLEEYRRAA